MATDRLLPEEQLDSGEHLISPSGRYDVPMQHDGNLVIYDREPHAIWGSGTEGLEGTAFKMQGDGNLVGYHNGVPVWSSNTFVPGSIAKATNDGDLRVVSPERVVLWSSVPGNVGIIEPEEPEIPLPVGRTGPVRISNRSFVDDIGTWNPIGTSLFWAIWAERSDPDRLENNLRELAAHGFDYVRILGMLSWSNRTIDPFASNYWDTVKALFARLKKYGLRAQVTVFADAQIMMPNHNERLLFCNDWTEFANNHEEQVLFLEVVNEGWQNGFDDINHLRDCGAQLKAGTDIPVALTSMPQVEGNVNWCQAYNNSGVDIVTIHYDRDTSKGQWRPVRQPWGWPIEYDTGCNMPKVAINNEPIGPNSSITTERDPLRLGLSYVTTFVSLNAAYVYHCGADVNVYDQDPAILDAFFAMRRLLPDGIANWQRYNANWAGFPWPGLDKAVVDGQLMRAYAASDGHRWMLVLLEQKADIVTPVLQSIRMTRYDARNGNVISTEDVMQGQNWTVTNAIAGSVYLGENL